MFSTIVSAARASASPARRLAAEPDVLQELGELERPRVVAAVGYSQIVVSGGPISGSIL